MNEKYSYYGDQDLKRLRLFRGTELVIHEGCGEEADPFRYVTYWFDDEGKLIGRQDPFDEERSRDRD